MFVAAQHRSAQPDAAQRSLAQPRALTFIGMFGDLRVDGRWGVSVAATHLYLDTTSFSLNFILKTSSGGKASIVAPAPCRRVPRSCRSHVQELHGLLESCGVQRLLASRYGK